MGKASRRKKARNQRTVKLGPEEQAAFQEQFHCFREKFGRDPGPDDPVFFDPDADQPVPLNVDRVNEEICQGMAAAGIRPEVIYAFRRTGLIVTTANEDRLRPEDREAWEAAIREYFEMEKRVGPQ